MKKNLLFLISLISLILPSQCVIIGVDVWCKVIDGQRHYIYCLGDLHLELLNFYNKQTKNIVEYAKKIDPNDILLLSEINKNDHEMLVFHRDQDTELSSLYDAFKSNELLVIGVEKRLQKILFYNKYAAIHYQNICKKILSYNDNLYLNKLYKQFVNATKAKFQILKENPRFYRPTIQMLALNEIEALHQIYINQHKKHIFLHFGCYHINFINFHLPNLGYKKIYSYGYKFTEINNMSVFSHKENKLQNPDINFTKIMEIIVNFNSDLQKVLDLNMQHVFEDLNDRFNIVNDSKQIRSKL